MLDAFQETSVACLVGGGVAGVVVWGGGGVMGGVPRGDGGGPGIRVWHGACGASWLSELSVSAPCGATGPPLSVLAPANVWLLAHSACSLSVWAAERHAGAAGVCAGVRTHLRGQDRGGRVSGLMDGLGALGAPVGVCDARTRSPGAAPMTGRRREKRCSGADVLWLQLYLALTWACRTSQVRHCHGLPGAAAGHLHLAAQGVCACVCVYV